MDSVNSDVKQEFRGGKILFLSKKLEIVQILLMVVLTVVIALLTPLDFIYSFGVAFLSAIAIMNIIFNSKLRVYVVDFEGISLRFGFVKLRLFKFAEVEDVYVQKYTTGHELIFVEIKDKNDFIKEHIISCDNNLEMVKILNERATLKSV